jgi:hypothetical protein
MSTREGGNPDEGRWARSSAVSIDAKEKIPERPCCALLGSRGEAVREEVERNSKVVESGAIGYKEDIK